MSLSPTRHSFLYRAKRCGQSLFTAGSGFTLVELMITMGILVFVLAATYMVFGFGWSSFYRATGRAAIQNNLRMAVEMISKELRYAMAVQIMENFDPGDIDPDDGFIYLFVNDQGRIEKFEEGASSIIPHDLDENVALSLTVSKSPSAHDVLQIVIEEVNSGVSIDTELRIQNLSTAINNTVGNALRYSKVEATLGAALSIEDFSDQFPDAEQGHNYGSVMITVSETADVETANLEVSLTLAGESQPDPLFLETQYPDQLKNSSTVLIFNIGAIDIPDTYTATVTAQADNAFAVTVSVPFTVGKVDGGGDGGDGGDEGGGSGDDASPIPNVQIPAGKILVFNSQEHYFLDAAVLKSRFHNPNSVYIPPTAGNILIHRSNEVLDWHVGGDLFIASNIETIKTEQNKIKANGNIVIEPGMSIMATATSNQWGTALVIEAAGDITVAGASLKSTGTNKRALYIKSGGYIHAGNASIEVTGVNWNATLEIEMEDGIDIRGADISSAGTGNTPLIFNALRAPATILVEGARVTPATAYNLTVVGTLAGGRIEVK